MQDIIEIVNDLTNNPTDKNIRAFLEMGIEGKITDHDITWAPRLFGSPFLALAKGLNAIATSNKYDDAVINHAKDLLESTRLGEIKQQARNPGYAYKRR